MATVNVQLIVRKQEDAGDPDSRVYTTPEKYIFENNIIIPEQYEENTPDSNGYFSITLRSGFMYIFKIQSGNQESDPLFLRRYVTGTGNVNFEDLPEAPP